MGDVEFPNSCLGTGSPVVGWGVLLGCCCVVEMSYLLHMGWRSWAVV